MSSVTDTVNTSDVKPLINDFDVETQETVSPTPGGPPVAHGRPALFRVKCGYCHEIFLFHRRTCIARCPHCRRTSPVGDYAKQRATIYGVLGVVLLLAGVGVTVGTYEIAKNSGGIYVVWIGAFVSGILFLIRSCYYGAMTVSSIEEEP